MTLVEIASSVGTEIYLLGAGAILCAAIFQYVVRRLERKEREREKASLYAAYHTPKP